MTRKKRMAVGCVSIIGLVLVAGGALVVLNWDAVFRHFAEALKVRTERAKATLFRLGEVMSISAELESEYGIEPHVTYSTDSDDRILSITLSDYRLPEDVTAKDHAREIAAFAIGKTKKFEEIDVVEVLFQTSAGGSESFSFAMDELISAPHADPATSDHSPRGRPVADICYLASATALRTAVRTSVSSGHGLPTSLASNPPCLEITDRPLTAMSNCPRRPFSS